MTYDPRIDIRVILENQHASGAYVASPGYSQYPYCWLRDGSFIAHAMDAVGETESTRAFHLWVARAIRGIEPEIRDAIDAKNAGRAVEHGVMPPARFTLEGRVGEGDWPNFQIDGYGQWLWSLRAHAATLPSLPNELLAAARIVADYLRSHWNEPCYDAWEEGRTQLHTSTLSSAAAGLYAAGSLLDASYRASGDEAWRFIRERCVVDGRFSKKVGDRSLDASLLWMATPFGLVSDDDPEFARTLVAIERELVVDGGVLRYPEDTFYGGGAWILLTAWLAWHHVRSGRNEDARKYVEWVERQRGHDGGFPEQVPTSRTDAWFFEYWTKRWGSPAHPLLWSHAMRILASHDPRH